MKTNKINAIYNFHTITANSVGEFVNSGNYYIISEGKLISSRTGYAQQAYGITLKSEDDLAKASKFWMSLIDENGWKIKYVRKQGHI